MNAPSPEDRFWSRVQKSDDPDACWLWLGKTSRLGYAGQIDYGKKKWMPYRLAYTLVVGPIPQGACVYRTCGTKTCCNPAHMWVGSPHDSTKYKRFPTKPVLEPVLPRRKGNTKLTDEAVLGIRRALQAGEKPIDIARRFGTTRSNVYAISHGVSRKNLVI